MRERTQLSQADEALRQTRLSDDTRTALLAIADRLTAVRPTGDMYEARRLALALRYAHDEHGDTQAGALLEIELLRHMPRLTTRTTRGEYALLLRAAARNA